MIIKNIEDVNMSALSDPQQGDMWAERYSWLLYVVKRIEDKVFTVMTPSSEFFRKTISTEDRVFRSFPTDGEPKVFTVDEFRKFVSYKSDAMSHKQWCDCVEREKNVDGWFEAMFEKNYTPKLK